MRKESVSSALRQEGISSPSSRTLLQAYDFLEQYRRYNCTSSLRHTRATSRRHHADPRWRRRGARHHRAADHDQHRRELGKTEAGNCPTARTSPFRLPVLSTRRTTT